MFEQQRERLIAALCREGYIKTESVKQAFLSVPREVFVPTFLRRYSYIDTPLDIGNGQTISAPHMVAIMCEELDIQEGQTLLEIGSGSGYHAAIVAQLVGQTGKVYSIERLRSLANKARENLEQIACKNVFIETGDGSCGLPSHQPYDRIYVTCAAPSIPKPLIEQLNEPGKLLIPVGSMYCELTLIKKERQKQSIHQLGGCVFVPLVGRYGHESEFIPDVP